MMFDDACLHAKSCSAVGVVHNFDRTTSWPARQIFTRHPRRPAVTIACVAILALSGCRSTPRSESSSSATQTVSRGGELVASMRTEPASFNRHAGRDTSTNLVFLLTQGRLVRVNQATQAVEPGLAESWTTSDDGLRVTMALRRGVAFSDGQPFTSRDVLFSFQAAYDPASHSQLADVVQAAGKNLGVEAPDDHTVVITYPQPFGPGVRLLDGLPILPRHKLEPALKAGTFSKAWGLTTPLSELAGLGPFMLSGYQPGQRLLFSRNPHYYGKAADGTPLPYLDRIV